MPIRKFGSFDGPFRRTCGNKMPESPAFAARTSSFGRLTCPSRHVAASAVNVRLVIGLIAGICVPPETTVMKDGVVVEHGTTADVFAAAPKHEYTKALFEAAPGRAFGNRQAVVA